MPSLTLAHDAPLRLDLALAKTLGQSRAQAQKMIKEGRVKIGESLPSAHLIVSPGTVVQLQKEEKKKAKEKLTPAPLNILYEDDNVAVLNKPAGLLVHGAPGHHEATLEDLLITHYPFLKKVAKAEKRHGIVHRLDREASGVLIIAKTDDSFKALKEQFAERKTKKIYGVLVLGLVGDDAGTVTFPIARSKTRARMAARAHGEEGKEAITNYEVVTRYTATTLLKVHIETGRTHQIRAHMFALGHPVVGDGLYRKKGEKAPVLPRLFLHAHKLSITLPSGERKTFTAPLPSELKAFLKKLKLEPPKRKRKKA